MKRKRSQSISAKRQLRARKKQTPSQRKREAERWMTNNKIALIKGRLCRTEENRAYTTQWRFDGVDFKIDYPAATRTYEIKLSRKRREEIARYVCRGGATKPEFQLKKAA